jgi:CheY-like chemotaxis protein
MRKGAGKLLVMDDEQALLTLENRSLTTLGYEVQSARDGAEASAMYEFAKASGNFFDAVLLDLTVSGGNGRRGNRRQIERTGSLRQADRFQRLLRCVNHVQIPRIRLR